MYQNFEIHYAFIRLNSTSKEEISLFASGKKHQT